MAASRGQSGSGGREGDQVYRYGSGTYGDVWADVYDDFFEQRENLDIVSRSLQELTRGGAVLEFGIGTGRIALALAHDGVAVHGVDASESMLEGLRAKPGGAEIPTTVGDFTTLKVDGEFSLVLIAFSAMFLLDSQETQVRCFENAARHLAPGGVFVVEAFVPDHSRWTRGQNTTVYGIEADLVDLQVGLHDRLEQVIVYQHVLIRESGIRLLPSRLRYAWPPELDLMGRLAGFRLRERWSDWQGGEFTGDSGSHVSVYVKG